MDQANARVLVDDIAKEEFEAIVDADPEAADRWYRLFSGLSEGARQPVHNLVLMLAYALRERCPKRAVTLLRSVYGEVGPIRFTVGRARVPLEAVIAWSVAGSGAGREWCHERLNGEPSERECRECDSVVDNTGLMAQLQYVYRYEVELREAAAAVTSAHPPWWSMLAKLLEIHHRVAFYLQ